MTNWLRLGLLVLVFHTLGSWADRLVVNTTCLELAKPSNQQRRLSCGTPDHYHCLLDETSTMEYEVCRPWKWIPGGKCAYFNTYGQGNVDERMCEQQPSLTLTCSTAGNQFKSSSNTQYTACYEKKATTAAVPSTTSSSPVTWTSEMENSTSSSDLGRIDKASQRKMQALYSVLGVLVPVLTLCVIYFVCKHSKGLHHCKEDPESNTGKMMKSGDTASSAQKFENLKSNDGKTYGSENAPSGRENVCSAEQEPLMSPVKTDDIPLMSGDANETNPVTQAKNLEEGKQVEEEILHINELVENTASHTEQAGNFQMNEKSVEKYKEKEENKTATDDLDNEHASDYESTEVFDDTIESLLMDVTNSIDEQEVKHCQELYDLLQNEGLDLIQEVLRLVITRTVGRTPEDLLADEAVKSKLKTILPIESHINLSNQKEGGTSVGVLYGLIQLYSAEKPKSGWGKPVRGGDIGISADVERLHRIFSIFKEIQDPKIISVDNYTRLLDIMLTACTRLDTADGEHEDSDDTLKAKCKVLADKLKTILQSTWSQSFKETFNRFIKQWSPW
ncbi:uncharacterized protein LOC111137658 isoform X2 [Crassostrea virginica]